MVNINITNHNTTISIVKAICIILMVVGHSGCPQQLNDIIYLFHMPCFFLVSGYLFKDKYLSDILLFLKNKIKGIWWPFVKWSFIFTLLHNVFASFHLYDNFYSISDYINKAFKFLTLTGSEQLLGGFWFLKELLYASVIAILSIKIFNFIFRKQQILLLNKGLLLSLLFVVFAYILSIVSFKIPTISSITMLATSFYMFGLYLKDIKLRNNIFRGFVFIVVIVVVSFFFRGGMTITDNQIFIYYIVAIIGSIAIFDISSILNGKAQYLMDYIGDKTLYILVFHFISFKLVSLIKILHYDLPIDRLSSFPVISEHNSYYWILYSVIGVIVPLLIWNIVKSIEHKLFKRTL